MSTDLENTAAHIDVICSKINADLSAIASIEIELAKNTAASFMATTNALLGKSVATDKTAVPIAAKPNVRHNKRKPKIKAAAVATNAIEKAAAVSAAEPVAA